MLSATIFTTTTTTTTTTNITIVVLIIIRLEARLQPNTGFNLRRVLAFLDFSGRHNSAMITDRRKFTTKYGMSSYNFYHWNHFKVIPMACTLRTRNLPKISATSDAGGILPMSDASE